MATRREQILSAVATTLASASGTNGRVYRSRQEPLSRNESPAVVLQMMDLYAVGNRHQALEDLQIMENRAKELINKAAERKQLKGRRR